MNAAHLLEELQRREVRLWANGERLSFDGPPEVLTPPVLAAMKASKLELLALLQAPEVEIRAAAQAAPVASVEVEPERQVLAAAPSPVEVLRPDLREPLGLAALDADPPEDPPANPAWASPAVWVRDLGVWQRCGGVVVTAATRSNWLRYYEAKKAWRAARPTEVDADEIHRAHKPNITEEAQVLEAPAQEGLKE